MSDVEVNELYSTVKFPDSENAVHHYRYVLAADGKVQISDLIAHRLIIKIFHVRVAGITHETPQNQHVALFLFSILI